MFFKSCAEFLRIGWAHNVDNCGFSLFLKPVGYILDLLLSIYRRVLLLFVDFNFKRTAAHELIDWISFVDEGQHVEDAILGDTVYDDWWSGYVRYIWDGFKSGWLDGVHIGSDALGFAVSLVL